VEGVFDTRGQLLRLDLPEQRLRGVEDEDQGLLVDGQRLQGLQVERRLEQGAGSRRNTAHSIHRTLFERFTVRKHTSSCEKKSQMPGARSGLLKCPKKVRYRHKKCSTPA